MQDVQFAATGAIALLTGVLAGLHVGSSLYEHSVRTLDAAPWVAYKQAKEAVFGRVMPAFFGIGLVSTIAGAALLPSHLPLGLAAALLAVVLVITVRIHLPLNALFQTWSSTHYPATWDSSRRRWRGWNLLRAVFAVAAFALVLPALR